MMKVLCVSGFLGANKDWDFLDKKLFSPVVVNPIELKGGFTGAAAAISKIAQNEKIEWILGYSLGGRLALSSVVDSNYYKGAIIFSSHLGLISALEKKQRMNADSKWADKFLSEPWEKVMRLWNAQDIFKNSRHPARLEKDCPRQEISRVLKEFSLGVQPDYRKSLKNCTTPILFVAGSQDEKYKQLAIEAARLNSKFKSWVAEGVGHRVTFDAQPKAINEQVIRFMEKL